MSSSMGGLVGVVQMTSTPDKENNFVQAKQLIHRAKDRGAQVSLSVLDLQADLLLRTILWLFLQMVFLPECFDVLAESRAQTLQMAEPLEGPTVSKYKALAQELGVWLSLGGLHEKVGSALDQFTNAITHVNHLLSVQYEVYYVNELTS